MRANEVKRNTKQKKHVQRGRGGKRGKTSGKGHKGQRSRAGGGPRPDIRDRIKRLPKLRGRGVNINRAFRGSFSTVKLSDIEANFNAGDMVTPKILFEKDLIRKSKGQLSNVKIVASGELKKKVIFKGVRFTEASKKAVELLGIEVK